MPRESIGGAYDKRGAVFARVTIAPGERLSASMPWVTAEAWTLHAPKAAAPCACVACLRAREVQRLTTLYRKAGASPVMVEDFVRTAAAAEASGFDVARRVVEDFAAGRIELAVAPKSSAKKDTLQDIADRWTSGELARLYPDHIDTKKSVADDEYRIAILALTGILARRADSSLTLKEIDAAMSGLEEARAKNEAAKAKAENRKPRKLDALEPASRRQYAQILSRLCTMAVYPMQLLKASPIPKGWLPKVGNGKAKGLIYPNEESTFLADQSIAIQWRIFFGFLARSGFRADEACSLDVGDVDVMRGILMLDENKTDDPRSPTYAAVPGFVDALAWWVRTFRQGAPADAPMFVQPNGERIRVDGLAERYRTMLEASMRTAGLYRPELFVNGARRLKVRVHDLRGAMVTYALANGRTETWVMDRTGHRSSTMVNKYRRPARTVAEAELGDLTPLAAAIPEIAAASTAAEAAADPETAEQKGPLTLRNRVTFGSIAQLVELRTFNP